MSQDHLAPGVAALAQARRSRHPLPALPEASRPTSLAEAHAMQDALAAELGERVAGWKVAPGKDGALMRGIIVGSRLLASPARIEAALVPLLGIEVEIGFRFTQDLPPRAAAYTAEEVAAAATALAGIEIVATRFESYTGTDLLDRSADFMSNGAYITGTERPDWRGIDLTKLEATLRVNGAVAVQTVGGLAWGDPMGPTLAMVNAQRAAGGIKAGQVITAGTYTGLHYAAPGDVIIGEFTGFGSAEVTLTA